ncbi:uncharacterized protein MYCFIDRAFT_178468 [Pseudocercospora fijiensis CIRAD86]|uniref:Uncharacterized protein n=1 Tax=Pseudocercospora fijiensis (strain CIRAD86) TaxID=383855 RepID=M3AMH4_PSEFD|nr:uncharacterized protein MYCFIDRAFT_178468 [Pseudocercospora fijiensis CIRAD86]EME78318.1 hypothetical protein MYCFIDRAFT_178468 [Pseudocercospora fijiensis CIRAD86]
MPRRLERDHDRARRMRVDVVVESTAIARVRIHGLGDGIGVEDRTGCFATRNSTLQTPRRGSSNNHYNNPNSSTATPIRKYSILTSTPSLQCASRLSALRTETCDGALDQRLVKTGDTQDASLMLGRRCNVQRFLLPLIEPSKHSPHCRTEIWLSALQYTRTMSNTNPAPQGNFNVTLDIRIPGSLVKNWEIPAETLSVQSTIDEVLAWIKSHIIKWLMEASYIDVEGFTGFMKRLSEDVQSPSISFATSVSSLDFKIGLNICRQPPGVPPATDSSMLGNLVHSRRQSATYITVGTVQYGSVGNYGAMQSTKKTKVGQAVHKNVILARFHPLKSDKFSGFFHTVPRWSFDGFSGGIGDPDASIEHRPLEDFMSQDAQRNKTLRLEELEKERRRQDGLSTVQSRNNDTEKLRKFHPPERPYMTFHRPNLTGFGNPPGVSLNAAVKLQAVIQVFYHFNNAPSDQNHVPRNMQLPVVGTMSVQALETAFFTEGRRKGQQEEDMIITKYRDSQPPPCCQWWVMPLPQTTRLLHRIEDKSVHVASFIPSAASATSDVKLYMECHIWDDPEMIFDGCIIRRLTSLKSNELLGVLRQKHGLELKSYQMSIVSSRLRAECNRVVSILECHPTAKVYHNDSHSQGARFSALGFSNLGSMLWYGFFPPDPASLGYAQIHELETARRSPHSSGDREVLWAFSSPNHSQRALAADYSTCTTVLWGFSSLKRSQRALAAEYLT